MEQEAAREKKEYGRIEWFFYIIFLPVLFTLILSGVLLTMLGYDVTGKLITWGNKVPYLEKIIPNPVLEAGEQAVEPPSSDRQIARLTQEISALTEKLQEKQAEVEKEKQESMAYQTEMKALKDDVTGLQRQLEQQKQTKEMRENKMKELSKLFATMTASKAAAVLDQLSLEEGVLVLAGMKAEEQAALLGKLPPKKAADLSMLLKDTALSENDDIAALQQRVLALTGALAQVEKTRNDLREMVSSFTSMNPSSVAEILLNMMKTDEEKAIAIIAQMSGAQRGLVLEQINLKDQNMAARITSKLLDM